MGRGGRRRTEDGGRRTEGGRRRTEDGGRKAEDGRRREWGRGVVTAPNADHRLRGRFAFRKWSEGIYSISKVDVSPPTGAPIRLFY